jgi:G3E family GTPase
VVGVEGETARLAREQIQAADIVVLNKLDLVSADELASVRRQVHNLVPGSRIIGACQGRVPLELIFETGPRTSGTGLKGVVPHPSEYSHGHPFSSWDWTSDLPLSLPGLRSALENLPDAVYRCKGILYLEELPAYRYVLQMVGKRYHLKETGNWGTEPPRSEIVLIGARDAIDGEELQRTFDACIGTGDEEKSPILRLARKIGLWA